jgi:hypothetical protein
MTLSEQEKEARLQAIDDFIDTRDKGLDTGERQCFIAGFQAGLTYNQKRIEELEAALKKISDTAKAWEGRKEAPYWNLGDIANAALKRHHSY